MQQPQSANPNRRSVRLPSWNYAWKGAYFVTAVTAQRALLFGSIQGDYVCYSSAGATVDEEWRRSREIRAEITLASYVVMPTHIHAIVWIASETNPEKSRDDADTVGATGRSPALPSRPKGPGARSLGALIASFKAAVTKRVNDRRGTPGAQIWQRSYYEHIIRDEQELNRIRQYILDNPSLWNDDPENPERVSSRSRPR
ncbi:MAG: transposase [Chloroflexota bacterium]